MAVVANLVANPFQKRLSAPTVTPMPEKSRAEQAMDAFLQNERSKERPAPEPKPSELKPSEPRVIERVVQVPVGPDFTTILGAILTAWLIITLVTAALWFLFLDDVLDSQRDLECAVENVQRAEQGVPSLDCDDL